MNQILVTQKLYITPELRRKKKMYKVQFFLSVLLVCLLFSYYIYAEYDRSRSEEVSKEILAGLDNIENVESENKTLITTTTEDNTVKEYDGMIVVAIEDDEEDDKKIIQGNIQEPVEYTASNGIKYSVEARVTIPRLGIDYPVISKWSDELLKISVNKYWGPKPNEVGNYCIVGHNYKSGKMFGNLPAIAIGDIVELKSLLTGETVKYEVYDRKVINPTDTACTSQLTGGRRELTLITCKEYGTQRLVVKAKEIK